MLCGISDPQFTVLSADLILLEHNSFLSNITWPTLTILVVCYLPRRCAKRQGGSPTHSRKKSLPITPGILRAIHCVWPQEPIDFNKVVMGGIFLGCLCFL